MRTLDHDGAISPHFRLTFPDEGLPALRQVDPSLLLLVLTVVKTLLQAIALRPSA